MVNTTRNTKSYWGLAKLSIVAVAVALFAAHASAQDANGIISGSVVDAEFGGGVSDVRITLVGTEISAVTDKDGRFLMGDVPEGEYTLHASAMFYKLSRIEELEVEAGNIARVDVPIYGDNSDIVELDGFTVKAKILQGSNLALLSERQQSSSISDAIGAETFSRLGIGDAAGALGKVPGVSISDGKYMVARGLSDRYNNTTMNGATVPSSDPDKRAVQLDQFPSSIIESISTVKTFTPDKAGSFTGAYVDIKTKSVPDAFFLTLSAGVSYNENANLSDILLNSGASGDWKGKDDGSRAVPEIASRLDEIEGSIRFLEPEDAALLSDISSSFSPDMEPETKSAPLSHGVSLSFGNRFELGKGNDPATLGVVGSISNKRGFSYYDDGVVGRYEFNPDGFVGDASFTEEKGVESNEWGAILNVALRPNANHEIGINSSYSRSGEDEAISRFGSRQASGSALFRVKNLHYTERTLSVVQLYGEHKFESLKGARVEWFHSESTSTQDEPDFRLFYDEIPKEGLPVYKGNFPAPRRYWRDLEEDTADSKIDFILPIGRNSNEIKFGLQKTETEREFEESVFNYDDNARGFSADYVYDGNISEFLSDDVIGLNPETGAVQRYIEVSSSAVPEYSGEQTIDSYYFMGDFRLAEKWRLIAGARNENTELAVQSVSANGTPNENDGSIDDDLWLPALNVVYELNSDSNLRFAATKTLARPNFRELSPFGSFDNIGGETFVGNPDLMISEIENFDLRWDLFGEGDNVVAVTAFMKDISNPIELNFVDGELTYVNVDTADVHGLEFEARKSFDFFGGDTSVFTFGGNVSYVKSEVARSADEISQKEAGGVVVDPVRELQGQSEFVGNIDASYQHFKKGTTMSLAYNYTGERLYSVSLGALPDVYEEPSGQLDFILSQRLGDKLSMKFALKNLLDDSSKKFLSYEGDEVIYFEYKKGITTSLSFSYKFY
ncbi:TonB-dependent receptor [Pelagicoccus mobilis]|uniref:TonB-dependent receptor n=1 Tax=Pelagicoccus mobilis TaxID=415221 RepID=A0A934VQF1_9BACT|nr:TonB-dependent receptor [Pelagicoccus mobilis]MBK1876830.1 TonB-dependent receptor [Pelagicoccus mobilis]